MHALNSGRVSDCKSATILNSSQGGEHKGVVQHLVNLHWQTVAGSTYAAYSSKGFPLDIAHVWLSTEISINC